LHQRRLAIAEFSCIKMAMSIYKHSLNPDCLLGRNPPQPLPTSPCQGRSKSNPPPDKGELEGAGLMDFLG
jgi:hypothetical protein